MHWIDDYLANCVPVSVYERDEDGGQTGNVARFVIPRTTFQARLAQEIQSRTGAESMLSRQVHGVSATNMLPEGMRFIWQNDERDAKYERPLALFEQREGEMPLLVLGDGLHHWRDLIDQAREARHYQPVEATMPYWDRVASEKQLREDRNRWVEQALSRKNGRKVFAFKNRAGLAGEWI